MSFRIIIDPALAGPVNMARDEALLESVGRGDAPPTLRFYQWSPATISLGYFQDIAEFESLALPARELAVVRRQTGGGAILHDFELTYSLTVPIDHPFVASTTRAVRADAPTAVAAIDGCGAAPPPATGALNASRMYEIVHDAAMEILRELGVPVEHGPSAGGGCSQRGPFFCFERHGPIDLLAGGRKIMGSAQRRTQQAVLQHGSLILNSRYAQQQCATVQEYAPVDLDALTSRLSRRITGDRSTPASFTPAELDRAGELVSKYGGDAWTRRQ